MVLQHMFGSADSLITIDLDAITANWRYMDSLSAASTLTASVVKADAYGLGADVIAPRLAAEGCQLFFVMSLDEGIRLRHSLHLAGFDGLPIFCLSGCHAGQEKEYLANGLSPVINDLNQIARLGILAKRHDLAIPAALHVDTGMTRLGLSPDETDWLVAHIQDGADALEGIELIYLMSHMSSAEVESAPSNGQQLDAFKALRPFFAKARASLANSGGVLLGKRFHFDMTRPGVALYGAHPAGVSAASEKAELLHPVVKWDARILQLRHACSGEAVGYGGTHILRRDSLIATVGVGYGDGYPRCLGGIAVAQIKGHPAPIIGRISMDSMALDVTDMPETAIRSATTARLLGSHYDISMMAKDAGTISYEILTSLGQRPARHYLGNSCGSTIDCL